MRRWKRCLLATERPPLSIATLDSRRFRAARSDCSCRRLKRPRLFPGRCLDNRSPDPMKSKPLTGSPPIPTAVDWPSPRAESCHTAS